ncbi:lactoylglutathione lyase protein [Fusarium avenaceum]|nr:Glyoxalase/Bleomycin resistance protein/Dihydroxybiphenyl dioxygenase [Fusarium avenaceum]KIL87755.1 lactoylglutathione lyase protein [Fusarium avenaceum]
MLPKASTVLLLAWAKTSLVLGCVPRSESPDLILGPDTPTAPETVGQFINHMSLNVNNLTRSIEFYRDVFGMRHLFTYNLTPHISFSYMSHSQGGRNGSAYQTTAEMLRYKNNNAGHLEFVYLNTTRNDIPGPPKQTSTLNHIGIIVPDLEAAQERMEAYGVEIYKKIGAPMPTDGYTANKMSIGDASSLSDEEWAAFQAKMTEFNKLCIFASDPDGNLLEVLPLNELNIFAT